MRHIDLCSHHNAAIRVVNYLLYLCTYLRSNERITTQDNNHRLEFEVPCHCTKYTSAFQPLVVICIFRTSFTTQPSTKPLIPATTLPPPYHTHTHTHTMRWKYYYNFQKMWINEAIRADRVGKRILNWMMY